MTWTPELGEFVAAGAGAWIFGVGCGLLWKVAFGWAKGWFS